MVHGCAPVFATSQNSGDASSVRRGQTTEIRRGSGPRGAGRDGTGRCGKKSHFAGREDRMLLGLLPPPRDVIGECRPMRSISLGRVEVGQAGL